MEHLNKETKRQKLENATKVFNQYIDKELNLWLKKRRQQHFNSFKNLYEGLNEKEASEEKVVRMIEILKRGSDIFAKYCDLFAKYEELENRCRPLPPMQYRFAKLFHKQKEKYWKMEDNSSMGLLNENDIKNYESLLEESENLGKQAEIYTKGIERLVNYGRASFFCVEVSVKRWY